MCDSVSKLVRRIWLWDTVGLTVGQPLLMMGVMDGRHQGIITARCDGFSHLSRNLSGHEYYRVQY
jgi:hypothetical protein